MKKTIVLLLVIVTATVVPKAQNDFTQKDKLLNEGQD